MKILVDDLSNAVYECGEITKGVFPDIDPNTELYKITNSKGDFYAVTNGFSVKSVKKIPDDYSMMCYTDEDGFYPLEIPQTAEEKKLETIESKIDYVAMMTDIEFPEEV